MARLNLPRLVLCATFGIGLSIAVGLHAASMVAARSSPDTALALFPGNGAAKGLVAFNTFSAEATGPADFQRAAATVSAQALDTLRSDPSSAKALALLALARPDVSDRHASALSASRINRRDLTLQAIVLEAHLAAGDFPEVVETLDQILRVHPDYSSEFFPVLGEAFRDERTLPTFERLLDGSSPWHEKFTTAYAIRHKDLLRSLALLRQSRELGDEEFDSELIFRLARNGNFAEASALYAQLAGSGDSAGGAAESGSRTIEWNAEFPPFDWRLSERADFRAQPSRDGSQLEFFARPGKGGAIAERIVKVPQAPFDLQLDVDADDPRRAENVRIELNCPGVTQPFVRQKLEQGANTLRVSGAPGCEDMRIVIKARAFSGQSASRGELSRIELVER